MKYKLLIILVLWMNISYSQDSIKLPFPVAKQVAKDLVSCDSLKEIHELTKIKLEILDEKILFKDKIISGLYEKDSLYNVIYKNEKIKSEIYKNEMETAKKKVRKMKLFSGIVIPSIFIISFTSLFLFILK